MNLTPVLPAAEYNWETFATKIQQMTNSVCNASLPEIMAISEPVVPPQATKVQCETGRSLQQIPGNGVLKD